VDGKRIKLISGGHYLAALTQSIIPEKFKDYLRPLI